jgi:hypothetical protein
VSISPAPVVNVVVSTANDYGSQLVLPSTSLALYAAVVVDGTVYAVEPPPNATVQWRADVLSASGSGVMEVRLIVVICIH